MAFPLLALGPLADLAKGILDRLLPVKMSEEQRAQIELELMKMDWATMLAQAGINMEEAKSENLFVAGWRPFIGWVCGSALAWNFVVAPFLVFTAQAMGASLPPLPTLDGTTLMPVLMGMLGLGTMRTVEKVQKANTNR